MSRTLVRDLALWAVGGTACFLGMGAFMALTGLFIVTLFPQVFG